MEKPPAFQFYTNNWLSSPRIMLMTPAQEGAYIRLLAICWQMDGLPDDDEQLAVLSRMGEEWLNGGSALVRKCFEPHPKREGFLHNERLLKEKKKQEEWRRKSQKGGFASAKSRRARDLQTTVNKKGGSILVEPPYEPNGNSSVFSLQSSSSQQHTEGAVENITPAENTAADEILTWWESRDGQRTGTRADAVRLVRAGATVSRLKHIIEDRPKKLGWLANLGKFADAYIEVREAERAAQAQRDSEKKAGELYPAATPEQAARFKAKVKEGRLAVAAGKKHKRTRSVMADSGG